jgi:hypothetical protein
MVGTDCLIEADSIDSRRILERAYELNDDLVDEGCGNHLIRSWQSGTLRWISGSPDNQRHQNPEGLLL